MTLNVVAMPSNSTRHLDIYRNDWQRFVSGSSNNGFAKNPVHELRNIGWQEFERIGFPIHRRGNELWKYTDLRLIDRSEFRFGAPSSSITRDELNQRVPLADAWHNIVFVDGVLDETLSDTGNAPAGSQLKSVGHFEHLGKLADCTDNAFVALNTAFLGDGYSSRSYMVQKSTRRSIWCSPPLMQIQTSALSIRVLRSPSATADRSP